MKAPEVVMRFLIALLLLAASPALRAAEASAPPSCWPNQTDGTGSLAYWDTNLTGFAVIWYCPPATTGPWTRVGFIGNWDEIPGGAIEAMKAGWKLLWQSTDGSRAAAWSSHITPIGASGRDYTSVRAMGDALAAQLDPRHIPAPPPPMTVAPAVYYIVQQRGKLVPVVVGSVAENTPCDPKQRANKLMAVPTSAVTWTGTARPLVVFAQCEYASP